MGIAKDNDPKHRSRFCTESKEKEDINVMEWPSQSPDANPIENMWALMTARLQRKNTFTLRQLKSLVKKTWKDFIVELCRKIS